MDQRSDVRADGHDGGGRVRALLGRSPINSPARIAYSLQLLLEFRRPVFDLHGETLSTGGSPTTCARSSIVRKRGSQRRAGRTRTRSAACTARGRRSRVGRLQLALLDLAGRATRERLVAEPDVRRHLERRQDRRRRARGARRSSRSRRRRSRTTAPTSSPSTSCGTANTAASRTAGCSKSAASTSRLEMFSPAPDHHVLGAVDDVEEALVVELAEVARPQPAVDERLGRVLGPAPVSGDDGRALDPDLARPRPPERRRRRRPTMRTSTIGTGTPTLVGRAT